MYTEKSDCEHVSPAMLCAGGGRCSVRDEMMTGFDDFDFSGGLVGVPWFNKGESDGSCCCVMKKVRRLLGRVTEFVATTADGTGRLGDCGGLWGGERHGLVIMASTIIVKIENPGFHFGFHCGKPRVSGIAAEGGNHPGYDRFIREPMRLQVT